MPVTDPRFAALEGSDFEDIPAGESSGSHSHDEDDDHDSLVDSEEDAGPGLEEEDEESGKDLVVHLWRYRIWAYAFRN